MLFWLLSQKVFFKKRDFLVLHPKQTSRLFNWNVFWIYFLYIHPVKFYLFNLSKLIITLKLNLKGFKQEFIIYNLKYKKKWYFMTIFADADEPYGGFVKTMIVAIIIYCSYKLE